MHCNGLSGNVKHVKVWWFLYLYIIIYEGVCALLLRSFCDGEGTWLLSGFCKGLCVWLLGCLCKGVCTWLFGCFCEAVLTWSLRDFLSPLTPCRSTASSLFPLFISVMMPSLLDFSVVLYGHKFPQHDSRFWSTVISPQPFINTTIVLNPTSNICLLSENTLVSVN